MVVDLRFMTLFERNKLVRHVQYTLASLDLITNRDAIVK